MKKLFLLLLVCIPVLPLSAQTNPFPQSFAGRWKGRLQWMVAGKPVREFSMQLIIQPADTAGQYTWQITYTDTVASAAAADNRPYLLKPVDTAHGHWLIDERDGILIDSYVHDNSFHGAFTVQGNTIVYNYRVEGNTMTVEFFSIKLTDKRTTGKGTAATPFVDSYTISSYQIGTLYRP